MKFSSLFFAVLLECLTLNSQAAEIVVGAEVAPLVAWADHCVLLFCNQNNKSGKSSGYGFHVGLWLPHDGIRNTGLYSSSTNSWGNYGQGGGTYSHQESGAGLLLGAGYILPFAPHLSARAAADVFFNVKVTDPVKSGNTMPETPVKLSLGVDYSFRPIKGGRFE